jgi:hypothetical protein
MALENTAQIVDSVEEVATVFEEPTENEKELTSFVVDHTDRWREYRDQNFKDDWDKYERIFRGKWSAEDKQRQSERSRIISPATQQAVETRHAEVMEAIFGQGEFFDIKDDLNDVNGNKMDVEKLKAQLYEDFAQDKIRKSIDQIELMAEIYGTGIGEITVSKVKTYFPQQQPLDNNQVAFGVNESERIAVKINPISPKNFLFDPNGVDVDDCMGVAIERYVSIHKIVDGIKSGKYKKVDVGTLYVDDSLEATQEARTYQDEKVLLITYYGLVPKEYLKKDNEEVVDVLSEAEIEFSEDIDDYADMVEAIIIIANGNMLLKAEETPYMMKDRPIISYQDDTVPNRLLGRGTVEKAFNMQMAIDGSMRSHMDSLALTSAPMMGMDATRLPRGAKFEVKPGGNFMVNGNPQEILFPFKFGQTDGQSMETSKEFERMLLMATGTIDSNGVASQVSREGSGLDMATATIIKKYKRTLVNFQEDFLMPFINKAVWRFMQYSPERYPSVDVKFIPTATLGIIAREYEQKQLAFLMQTLGAQSPLTPILMKGILSTSSLSNREQMIVELDKAGQANPQEQQMQMQEKQVQLGLIQAQTKELESKAMEHISVAQKNKVDAELAPKETEAKVMNAISTNLPSEDAAAITEFDRRVQIAGLMLKEEEVQSKKEIVKMQMAEKKAKSEKDNAYLDSLQQSLANDR